MICAIWACGSPVNAEDLLPPDRPIAEVIDHYIDLRLAAEGVTPVPQARDATLVRRLTLDLEGRTPTAAEARSYIESDDPNKQAQLVDRLMSSPFYPRHAATELDTMLKGPDGTGPELRDYLLDVTQENRAWDRVFRELIGETEARKKPERFVSGRVKNVDVLTRDVSAIFFGINVTCCQCHTHPYVETLTQDYFHGMKGFFSRSYEFEGELREKSFGPKIAYETGPGESKDVGLLFLTGAKVETPKPDTDDLGKSIQEEGKGIEELRKAYAEAEKVRVEALATVKEKEEEKKTLLASEVTPEKAKLVEALDKEIATATATAEQVTFVYPENASYSYRNQLADIALRAENESLFARSIINRLWHRLIGYGLVMRIDQMHGGNPGSHPELLEWLARDMKTHGYDLLRLVRGIVNSRAYSRSSEWDPNDPRPPSKEFFAVANLRPLTPMQYGVSVLLCGDPAFPPAADAFDATMTGVENAARDEFGAVIQQPSDDLEISADEALGISNDAGLLEHIGQKLVPELLKIEDRNEQIASAVWWVLSRPPTAEELRTLGEYVREHTESDGAQVEDAFQQAVWALTTSAEFRFNH
jgi:hypothetical protein